MMSKNKLIPSSLYIEAFIKLATEAGSLNDNYKELLLLQEQIFDQPNFFKYFFQQSFNHQAKFLEELKEAGVSRILVNFLYVLRDDQLLFDLNSILEELKIALEKCVGIQRVVVYSYIKLSPDQLRKIQKKINAANPEKIKVFNKIDTSLLGGVKLKIENTTWDNSIQKQLSELSKLIMA